MGRSLASIGRTSAHADVRSHSCPSCGAGGLEPFYEVRQIPARACVMLDDREAAQAYPRGDLSLGFCRACGFITNVLFQDGGVPDTGPYEDQQSFSPSFRAFQTDLVRRLVDRYAIRGRDVVEIGCGKGDFLIELCRTGGNRGVGIDPICTPGEVPADGGRVRFIADKYGQQLADVPCDFLCCRHTLEHLPQVGAFLREVRETIGERFDTLVFFEVPDVQRVLREQAFWDVYYEHCSYFSLGSLARLFRAAGFDVVELARTFGEQYLFLVARPSREPTHPSLPQEQDLAAMAEDVEGFRAAASERVRSWRERLREEQRQGRRVAIWGSGSKCVGFLSTLGLVDVVEAIVDINPRRHGKFLAGLGSRIEPPESLRDTRPDLILVMNPLYVQEIGEQVRGMGIRAEVTSV